MSGTSVDGVDVALVEIAGEGFDETVRPIAFRSFPYPAALRRAILGVSDALVSTREISQMNFRLGEIFAEAVVQTCRQSLIPLEEVDLVGSHGQTIYHQATPEAFQGRLIASTLQIGEPSVIAARTGLPVVADFRPADMAVGGQGAPLVPYVDYLLYRDRHRGRVALNVGGIANLTAIPPGASSDDVIAFDTGPGNMLIDALVSQFSRGVQRYDEDGRMAASGKVNVELLEELLDSPYLRMRAPKSCGREQYGAEYVAALLRQGLAPADLVATVTAFTAASVAVSLERFIAPRMAVDDVIVSGGGARNPEIVRGLRNQLPDAAISLAGDWGVDGDSKEAVAFAVLAYESWHGRPANPPSATGARARTVLGKICRPPQRRIPLR